VRNGVHWHGLEHGPFVQPSKAAKRGALDSGDLLISRFSLITLLPPLAFGCANGGPDTATGFAHDAGKPTSNDPEVDASDDGSGSGAPDAVRPPSP
jgi:hypothetical protein